MHFAPAKNYIFSTGKCSDFKKRNNFVRVKVHQPGGDGVSELRVRLASLSDSGEYQCSTAQYYDYQAASTTIRLRVEDMEWSQENGISKCKEIPPT